MLLALAGSLRLTPVTSITLLTTLPADSDTSLFTNAAVRLMSNTSPATRLSLVVTAATRKPSYTLSTPV